LYNSSAGTFAAPPSGLFVGHPPLGRGMAPCIQKLLVTKVEPLDTGGDTHKPPIPAQVCRTLKVELCTESANIGAVKN